MPVPVDPFKDDNPFDNPIPFIADISGCLHPPMLLDQLNVELDDSVRVLKRFDNGWGLVAKVSSGEGRMREG